MGRYRLAAIIGVLAAMALLIVAAESHAATVSGPGDLQASYATGVAWWGGPPEWCGSVTLSREAAGVVGEGDAVEVGHAQPPFQFGSPCAIAIAEGVEGCALEETMRHEIGHLRGLGHSTDPHSVMYPSGDVDRPLCQAERLGEYEAWQARERARCQRRRRPECWATWRGIRAEVRRRAAALAATPAMLR